MLPEVMDTVRERKSVANTAALIRHRADSLILLTVTGPQPHARDSGLVVELLPSPCATTMPVFREMCAHGPAFGTDSTPMTSRPASPILTHFVLSLITKDIRNCYIYLQWISSCIAGTQQ